MLETVVLPHTLENMWNTFQRCPQLTEIYIPENVCGFDNCFSECEKLSAINVDDRNKTYYSKDGVVYSKQYSRIEIVPGGIESFTLPANISEVADVNNTPFHGCVKLKEINVDSDNPYYASKDGVLYSKDFSTLVAFPPAKQNIEWLESVNTLDCYSFNGCKFTELTLPNTIKIMKNGVFWESRELVSIFIPEGIIEIPDNAFLDCWNLKEVHLPSTLRVIGGGAFMGCALEEFVVPDGVEIIKAGAFQSNIWLHSFTIGRDTKYIGDFALGNRAYLKNIINRSPVPQEILASDADHLGVFNNVDVSRLNLYVFNKYVNKYKEAEGWKDFGNIIGMEDEYEDVRGDVNGDLQVNVTDAVGIIRDRLGYESDNFDRSCSDINQDGQYTMDDADAIISIMYGDEAQKESRNEVCARYVPSNSGRDLPNKANKVTSDLTIWDVVSYEDRADVYVNLVNYSEDIVALQFNLFLPDGIEPVMKDGNIVVTPSGRISGDYTLRFSQVADGSYLFTYVSNDLTPISNGDEYMLMTFSIKNLQPTMQPLTARLYGITATGIDGNELLFDVIGNTYDFNIQRVPLYNLVYYVDGNEYLRQEIPVGNIIYPADEPTKEGYTFSGWSEIPETMPAHDVEVTGEFVKDALINNLVRPGSIVTIYNYRGLRVKENHRVGEPLNLPSGIYIVNGQKFVVK